MFTKVLASTTVVTALGCNQKEGCLDFHIAGGWEAVDKVTDQTKITTPSVPTFEKRCYNYSILV